MRYISPSFFTPGYVQADLIIRAIKRSPRLVKFHRCLKAYPFKCAFNAFTDNTSRSYMQSNVFWRQINDTRSQVEDMRAREQNCNRHGIIAYAIEASRRFTLVSDRDDGGDNNNCRQPAFLAYPKAVLGRTQREGQRKWQLGSSLASKLSLERVDVVSRIYRQYTRKLRLLNTITGIFKLA